MVEEDLFNWPVFLSLNDEDHGVPLDQNEQNVEDGRIREHLHAESVKVVPDQVVEVKLLEFCLLFFRKVVQIPARAHEELNQGAGEGKDDHDLFEGYQLQVSESEDAIRRVVGLSRV